jgi:ESCRT-II complex subunit VPS22
LFSLTRAKAAELQTASFERAVATIETLRTKVTDYLRAHEREFATDPAFRQRFLELCAPLGFDPLTILEKNSAKNKLFTIHKTVRNDYHLLAVHVAEVCLARRSSLGGMMSLSQLQQSLQNKTNKTVSASDIQVAIQKLRQLGGGFRTVTVGTTIMVVSVPQELDGDHMQVLTLAAIESDAASDSCGITVRNIMDRTSWTRERAQQCVDLLLQQGMAWVDEYQGEFYYWFPSIWQDSNIPK